MMIDMNESQVRTLDQVRECSASFWLELNLWFVLMIFWRISP